MSITTRGCFAGLLLLLLIPQTVHSQLRKTTVDSKTAFKITQAINSPQVPAHTFPSYAANYQSYIASQTACTASGGSFNISGCNVPPPPIEAPTPLYVAPVVPYGQPDNFYKAFIYNHESGNDPTRWNSSGCLGLGQACPASKLLAVCPTMDYGCEDSFFTNYAISRYGSWAGAYNWWLSHNWW